MKRLIAACVTLGLATTIGIGVTATFGASADADCWDEYNLSGSRFYGTLTPRGRPIVDCTPADRCFTGYNRNGTENRLFVPLGANPRTVCAEIDAATESSSTTTVVPEYSTGTVLASGASTTTVAPSTTVVSSETASTSSTILSTTTSTTQPPTATTTPTGSCEPSGRLLGATEMMPPPVWCSIVNTGPGTEVEGANSWVDNFDHGLSFADFSGTKYREFTGGWYGKAKTWRHANHWMVDMVANPLGGTEAITFVRPDRTFRFEDGKLVVEAVVAAGIEEYGSPVWPEILVTTGAQPDFTKHGSYGYEKFPEDWTLGCRLQSTGYPVCALKSNNGKTGGAYSTRIYEIAPLQVSGSTNYYAPFDGVQPHRFCQGSPMQVMDAECRDLFRLELSETSLTLFVNGVKHFEQTGLPRFPVADQDVYVYFPSVIAGLPSGGARFHWDRLAVNP